ncbi:MAG: hypothetical protein RLZZ303_1331, partial [Candidatus Hydrogenedentota bacterium]
MRFIVATLLFTLALTSHAGELSRLRVSGDAIVDLEGREVVLRGVNLGKKNAPFLPERSEEDYAALARWGFNCVRFYINWAAIEPAPGEYDVAFLDALAQHVAWANQHGIYVMLDIHQDLYSGAIPGGNGAPAWATLDDGKPHVKPDGPWGMAYFTSPQVHQAFDSFWANRPGPGDVGLQDRFAAAAQALARKFADVPGVVGIDLYNEPGMGSDVTKVVPALISAVPKLMTLPDPPMGLLAALSTPDGAAGLEQLTLRQDIYLWMLDAITPVLQEFEQSKLQPFYDRVGSAVREVTPNLILFFEPPVLANSGAKSSLRPMQDATGRPLSNQAYAAHAYDLVTDSDKVADPSSMRLDIMFERLAEHARQMGLPAVVGEWGAYYGNPNARAAAKLVVTQLEKHGLGDLYWDYESELSEKAFFDQLCRPYPQATAGELESWSLDQDTRVFTMAWKERSDLQAPTRIYVPRTWYQAVPVMAVKPESKVEWTEIPGSDGGWIVEVAPVGAEHERT